MNEEELIEDLIQQGESDELEFKQSVRKEDIAKTLCSFLNGKGGRILVGVSDRGDIVGLANANNHLEQLKMFLLPAIIPEAPVTISVETVEDRELLMLKVYGGSKQPYLFDGSIYYRRGASTVKATSQQISELIHGRQQSELHWERQASLGIDLDDLDKNLIFAIIKESQENHRGNYKGNDVVDFLYHYGLYQNGSITNACVVLFAKYPARYIPQVRVRLTEYSEGKTGDSLLRDEVFEDNLFIVQEKLERYVNGLGVRSVFDKNQWKRIDFKFPVKALQEGIINALMHRDYSTPSGSVSISVYPDSFVVSNSGHLPNDLNVNQLKKGHRSHPINPDIAHVVFLRGLIDKLGRGTVKLVEECQEAGLKDPVWKDTIDGVTLIFNGPKALPTKKNHQIDGVNDGVIDGVNDGVSKFINDGVNDGVIDGVNDGVRVEIIRLIEAISANEGAKALDIATKRGKSKPTIERYLKLAKELGIVEFRGVPKTGGYFLTKAAKEQIRIVKPESEIHYVSWDNKNYTARLGDIKCYWTTASKPKLVKVEVPDIIHTSYETQGSHPSSFMNYLSDNREQWRADIRAEFDEYGNITFYILHTNNMTQKSHRSANINFLDWNGKLCGAIIKSMKVTKSSNKAMSFVLL